MSIHLVVNAILGGTDSDSLEHFNSRVEHCARLEPADARRYLTGLQQMLPRSRDVELREAMVILELGQPQVTEQLGLDPVEHLTAVADVRERQGRLQRASTWLTLGWQVLGQPPSIQAAIQGFRDRQLERTHRATEHLARADEAAKAGRLERAEQELEALRAIEPSHPHASKVRQTIANRRRRRGEVLRRVLARSLSVLLLCACLGGMLMIEASARQAYAGLEVVRMDEPSSAERRLADLNSFIESHPIWLGSLSAIEERATLKVQVGALRRHQFQMHNSVAAVSAHQSLEADQFYFEGRRLADVGRFGEATQQFEQALRMAPNDWSRRDRVQRDIAALNSLEAPESK